VAVTHPDLEATSAEDWCRSARRGRFEIGIIGEMSRNNATDSDREAFSANREIAPVRGYSRPKIVEQVPEGDHERLVRAFPVVDEMIFSCLLLSSGLKREPRFLVHRIDDKHGGGDYYRSD
jgi:hypothetical protein